MSSRAELEREGDQIERGGKENNKKKEQDGERERGEEKSVAVILFSCWRFRQLQSGRASSSFRL